MRGTYLGKHREEGTRSHKLFLIKRSSMKRTQLGKVHLGGKSNLFELISVPSDPIKQIHSIIKIFAKKPKIL